MGDASARNRSGVRAQAGRWPCAMNEAFPGTDRHNAECNHFDAAFTIARMPALITSGSLGQAATNSTDSGRISRVTKR